MKTYVETRTKEESAQEISHIADFLGCNPQEIGEAKETTIIHSKLGVKSSDGEIFIYRKTSEKKNSQRVKKRERRFNRIIETLT